MLVLSPAAVARLESHTPAWPMPKVFRLTSKGKFTKEVREGAGRPRLSSLTDRHC